MYFISLGCNCYIKMYLTNHNFDIININNYQKYNLL